MARNPRLAAVRRALLTRRAGWGLAAALALLGILLGWHQFTRTAGLTGQSLAEAARLVLDAGSLLPLLAAAGLVLGLALSSPRRAVFPAALILLAAGLGLWGRLLLVSSTPTPPQLENQGHIMVYTSDPKARVVLFIDPLPDVLEQQYAPSGHWIEVQVVVENPTGAPLVCAVALGEDAQFPPGSLGLPPGSLSEPGRRRGPFSTEPASFVNGVSWSPAPDPGYAEGTVILGRKPGAGFDFSLWIPMREPLLVDVGEYVTLSTPTLGRPSPGNPLAPRKSRRWRHPIDFDNKKADPKLLARLQDRPLYEPERLQLGFDGENYAQLADARQEAGTAPIAPFRTEWRAMDTLQVQASFRRPGEAAKNQRLIFFAGVLVSLAASFFVWALELWFGPGRDPVTALRRRP